MGPTSNPTILVLFSQMQYVISGSRTITHEKAVERILASHLGCKDVVLVGDARGVDAITYDWARRYFCEVTVFKADWDKHGRAAGPIRNREMAEQADVLIAIWDGKSRGTKNMIDTALELRLETHVHFVRAC